MIDWSSGQRLSLLMGGRSLSSGLFCFLVASGALLSGCGFDPGPVADPVADYVPSEVSQVDGTTHVQNFGPKEVLHVYEEPPNRGLRFLYMQNRAATVADGGVSAWPDRDGARILLFDDRGTVSAVLQGAPEGQRPLTQPISVALGGDGFYGVEADGSALRFADGAPIDWSDGLLPGPARGGVGSITVASRSLHEFSYAYVPPGSPLMWVRDEVTGEIREIGEVEEAPQPLLSEVVNTGWPTVSESGDIYFAAATQPVIKKFSSAGELLWESRWTPAEPVPKPKFMVVDGALRPDVEVMNWGIVEGLDGNLYVLGAQTPGDRAGYLLVFQPDGTLLRAGTVPTEEAIFVDRRGHVYSVPADDALARTGEPERAMFPSFELPRLGSEDIVSLEEYRGKVLVVNFWASWCIPCREEMPLLREFSDELDPSEAVILGLNEDVRPSAGIGFLDEIGGVPYANFEGRGQLKRQYGYRGLPYTLVLDRELRIIRSFYGFGTSIDPIKEAVRVELARGATIP